MIERPVIDERTLQISELLARAAAVREAAQGLPDALFNDIVTGAWKLEMAALALPCADDGDLEAKLRLWDALIEDPSSILEDHLPLWEQLKADWKAVLS